MGTLPASSDPGRPGAARLADWLRRLHVPTYGRALLPTMTALAVQLLAFVLTARGLGVAQFGVYTSILAVAVIATDFVGLGAHEVMMRETARDRSAYPAYFGHLLAMSAASLLPIVLVSYGVAAGLMRVPLNHGLLVCALLAEIVLARALNHAESIMVAHGDAVRAGVMRLRGALFRLGAAILYFLVLDQNGLQGWILSIAALTFAVLAYCYHQSVRLYGAPSHGFFRREVGAGVLLGLPQVTFSILSNADRMVLARFVPAPDVGAYGVATRALQVGLFPLQVGTRVTYPHFFAAHNSGARSGLRFAARVSVAMVLLGLLSMGLLIAVSYAVPLIFGTDFSSAQPILIVLALSLPLTGLVTPPADVLTALNRQGLRAACYIVVALVFVGLAVAAAQLHGVFGVACAYVLAIGMLALALWGTLLAQAWREQGQ